MGDATDRADSDLVSGAARALDTLNISSPVKRKGDSYRAEHVVADIEADINTKYMDGATMDEFWEALRYKERDFHNVDIICIDSNIDGSWLDLLNETCNAISEKDNNEHKIRFVDASSKRPHDHATGTYSRPDLVGIRVLRAPEHGDHENASGQSPDNDEEDAEATQWSQLEAIVELHSKGTSALKSKNRTAAYTYYLLQGRPDLTHVLGLHCSYDGWKGAEKRPQKVVRLYIAGGARGIFFRDLYDLNEKGKETETETEMRKWRDKERMLFYAFCKRLLYVSEAFNVPNISRSVPVQNTATLGLDTILFDIESATGDDVIFSPGWQLLSSSKPFSKRTFVYHRKDKNDRPQIVVGAKSLAVSIIKDSYREKTRRFKEECILETIHKLKEQLGPFPGVIELVFYQVLPAPVSLDPTQEHEIVRLFLNESGVRLVDVLRLDKFLMGLYDLLEVLRALHTHHGILHRDISEANVLVVEENIERSSRYDHLGANSPMYQFSSINHILRVDGHSHARTSTRILLIDFDQAQDLRSNIDENSKLRRRSVGAALSTVASWVILNRVVSKGTPIFTARAVQLGAPLVPAAEYASWDVPDLVEEIRDRYEKVHPSRLANDFKAGHYFTRLQEATVKPDFKFAHQLKHDAESVYWLLTWWAIRAQGSNNTIEGVINPVAWHTVTSTIPERRIRLVKGTLDVFYKDLEDLLTNVVKFLDFDTYWAPATPQLQHSEIALEAFQRHLLNFLVQHDGEPLLKDERHAKARTYDHAASTTPSLSTSEVSIRRDVASVDPTTGQKRKAGVTGSQGSKKNKQ